MTNSDRTLPKNIQHTRSVVLIAYYCLLLYFLVSGVLAIGGLALATPVIWLIQIIPLLLFLRGLHKSHLRTYGWVCFVILLYFIHAVLVAFDPARRWLGIIEITLCSVIFAFLIVFIRQYRQHYKVNL